MSISIGGVDLFRQGLENEHNIIILQMIVEKILDKNPTIISQEEIEKIREEALSALKKKYPDAGIKSTGGQND